MVPGYPQLRPTDRSGATLALLSDVVFSLYSSLYLGGVIVLR